jgi:putative ABC transport system permease protein
MAHRSAIPGVVLLAAGLVMIFFSGGWGSAGGRSTLLQLAGLLATSIGLLLVTPACVTVLSALAGRTPVVTRLALRDLARYRARSGAALAAVSFAVFLAMVVCLLAGGRFADAVDYAGPNLPANELLLHPPGSREDGPQPAGDAAARTAAVSIGQALGPADVLELRATDATLLQGFRGDPGTIYLATPALLRHYGIDPASVDARADLITSRSGLDKLTQLHVMAGGPDNTTDLQRPVIQRLTKLPTGASEPNLLITSQGLAKLGFPDRPGGWLFTTPHALTASQINAARQVAAGSATSIETKSEAPSLDQLRTWSTTAGLLLALAVLAMTVGLIRSEAARDLITLTAVGAARRTRRALTGITAGTLGLMGALLGTTVAYLVTVALFRSQLSEKVAHPPVADLVAVLIGLPVVAAALGWLLAGREPRTLAHTPAD